MVAKRILTTDDKTQIENVINNSKHLKCEVVTVLPDVSQAKNETIYLKKEGSYYEAYMLIDGVIEKISGGGSSGGITSIPLATATEIGGVKVGLVNNHEGDLRIWSTGQLRVQPKEYRYNIITSESVLRNFRMISTPYILVKTLANCTVSGYFGFGGTTTLKVTINANTGFEIGTVDHSNTRDGIFNYVECLVTCGKSKPIKGILECSNKKITFFPDTDVTFEMNTTVVISSMTWGDMLPIA